MGLNSAIYEGRVRHRRFGDVQREFSYRVYMMYLDLAEIPQVMAVHPLWSTRPRSPVSFRRSDFLGPADRPLADCVRDRVEQGSGVRPDGPVRMLSNLRHFGLVENPVTFYYCFDRSDTQLQAVLAEVTNTPWGDRHCYVVDGVKSGGAVVSSRVDKAMHVSPLMDMEHTYELTFGLPGASLPVHIDSEKNGRKAFDATLKLSRTEIDRNALSRLMLRHSPMSWKVLAGIYSEAAKTWLSGARFHPRPAAGSGDPQRQAAVVRDSGARAACPV